jgi:hypothetical protein
LARILDGSANTRAALVALMKAIARYGRPSSLPDDVRAAWDDCENIVGYDTVLELITIASQGARERERQRPARRSAHAVSLETKTPPEGGAVVDRRRCTATARAPAVPNGERLPSTRAPAPSASALLPRRPRQEPCVLSQCST